MDILEQLRASILQLVKANVPVQVVYATCKEVQAEAGTMTAEREGIEYFDVLLGLGQDITIPVVGSRVMLGLLENKRQATWLLFAEAVKERRINGNALGGLVMVEPLVAQLNELKSQVNQLKGILGSWVPVPNDGGLALKAAAATWAGQPLATTARQQLENPVVSHG